MSLDLFSFHWDHTEGGCCIRTGGEIEVGSTPVEITVDEEPGVSGWKGDAGPYPLTVRIRAGDALQSIKHVTPQDIDENDRIFRATQYVASLHIELGNVLNALENSNRCSEERRGMILEAERAAAAREGEIARLRAELDGAAHGPLTLLAFARRSRAGRWFASLLPHSVKDRLRRFL